MMPLQIILRPRMGSRSAIRAAAWVRFAMLGVLFLSSFARMEAAIITAADDSQAAVQTAVQAAQNGDTVKVPAGTGVWTSTLLIAKNVQLIGAGIGQTIIVDEESRSGSGDHLITWTTLSNGFPRLSGFTFQGGVTNITPAVDGALSIGGTCASFRIDHCKFNLLYNKGVLIYEPVFGVVDHCTFIQTWNNGIEVYGSGIAGDSWGDGSWATPVQWGSTNFLYIENCSFSYSGYPYPYVDDGYAGARIVFRYNSVTNEGFQNHGTESAQRNRGCRAYEVYENTFVQNAAGYNAGDPIYLRSGTGVIFSNTFTGYANMISLLNFRSTGNFMPWGSANGQNGWDSNNISGALATGTHTAANNANGVLTDSSQTWTINQWVGGYEVQDVALGGTNTGSYSLIISNSAHDIYTLGDHLGVLIHWTNGAGYKIYQCYHQLDQIGLGSGDLVADTSPNSGIPINTTTGTPVWPHEVSEPMYQWGNTLNGTPNAAIGSTRGYGGCNIIMLNRDYFDNTPKPGYTPLAYPHPLTLTTSRPSPPSNLDAGPSP